MTGLMQPLSMVSYEDDIERVSPATLIVGTVPTLAKLTVRVADKGGEPRWLPQVVARLKALYSLGKDWDSHGAEPVHKENVFLTIDLLARTLGGADMPVPRIVPTVGGGLQL